MGEISRMIGKLVLASQIVLNLRKCIGDIGELKRPESPAPGGVGYSFQYFVIAVTIGASREN